MKKFSVLIFAAALIIGLIVSNIFSFGRISDKFFNFSFNFKGIKGSGQTGTEMRQLSGFKKVEVGGVIQVEITAQKDFSVEVEADDNLLPMIKTEISGGTLKISTVRKLSTSNPIRVRISAPDIDSLDISGASTVAVNNLKNAGFAVDASGASKIKLAGETAKLTVEVSGASGIDAETLTAENADIDASGASSVIVNVTGDLTADASGASKIIYVGTPKNLNTKKSGASRVSAK